MVPLWKIPCSHGIGITGTSVSRLYIGVDEYSALTSQYSLYIHSPLGPCLTHFSPSSPSFSLSIGEDPGMGIKTVTWAPGGRWIAVGGWDNKVRIVESEGWRCVGLVSWGGRINDKTVVSPYLTELTEDVLMILDCLERTERLDQRYKGTWDRAMYVNQRWPETRKARCADQQSIGCWHR